MSVDVVEELGLRIPQHWHWATLGDVCHVEKGRTPREEWYRSDGIRLIRYRDVTNSGILWEPGFRSFVGREFADQLRSLPGNTTLVTADAHDPKSIGSKVCYVELKSGNGIQLTYSGELIAVTSKNVEDIHPQWPYYWLRSQEGYKAIQQFVDGVHLNVGRARKLPIPVAPYREQKRIAALLNEQMATAEKVRAAVESQASEGERLETAYFRQAFRGIVPLAVSEIDQSEPPQGWSWCMLGDLARLESGHTPSRNRPDWWGGDVPWLALPDIRNLDGKVATGTTENTNDEGLANSSARLLPESTVCLSRTASVGFVTILGRPMATSQDFVNWICEPMLDASFLMHLLRASRNYIRSLSSGAIHKTVYMPTVKAFRVCVPDVTAQREISAFLNMKLKAIEALRDSIGHTTSDIELLPPTFLRCAFSGQL